MSTLDEYCATNTNELQTANRLRKLIPSARQGIHITQGDISYLSFSCNDYLGLSQHPAVIEAAVNTLETYGVGAGSSRLVTGNHPLYAALEHRIAGIKNKDAALVFGSGYLTNIGIIPALISKDDIIFADKLVHACLIDGAQLSQAALARFRHNDMEHLETLLKARRSEGKNALILVDHVYSMDGDIAPLAALSALAKEYDAWLLADDAHGLGIIKADPAAKVDLWMGTFSKATGGYGGYVAANRRVIDYLVSSARSAIFSTGLPPATLAANLAALDVASRDPALAVRALRHAKRVAAALGQPEAKTTIVPLMLGAEETALAVSAGLKKRGILAAAIRPPTVPPGTSRLRLTFSALHEEEHIDQLLDALHAEGVVLHG